MSLRTLMAPFGSFDPSGAPAPRGSSVVEASSPTTFQCQKPDGVGASGSKHETAKPRVSAGKPSQRRCGEVLPPEATKSFASGSPSRTSSLVTVKDATFGNISYGSGACGRSRFIVALSSARIGCSGSNPSTKTQLSRRHPRRHVELRQHVLAEHLEPLALLLPDVMQVDLVEAEPGQLLEP